MILLAVLDTYRVETRAFRMVVLLATVALPIHYLAPFRWKKPLFITISIVGLFLTLGPGVAAIVMGIGAILLAMTAAPLPWVVRSALIAAVAVGLAAMRPGPVADGDAETAGAIPVVASLFMFRMVIYLYELKHARGREPIVDAASYFLLLPNFVFPHFPVVDYRTFQRGYFARGIHEIQRVGLAMMSRGTVHLLAYRVIDRLLLITPDAVDGPAALASFVVCNYLLYLRVSGQFHIACGMLHLFGFQLPETHHRYLLASSFTDYWRRINIYWKDFMIRVVFNPVVFRLKRWPQPLALATATATVFMATWFLHAYQSFWLRGVWGFGVPDALFWGILGVLVLINVQLDAHRPPARRSRADTAGPSVWARMLGWLRVAATFTTIAVLWSLWSSPSLESWLGLLRRGLRL
ncbi:MAG: hypothetical protein ACYC61_07400 [Isosphaeraceae bacterium]